MSIVRKQTKQTGKDAVLTNRAKPMVCGPGASFNTNHAHVINVPTRLLSGLKPSLANITTDDPLGKAIASVLHLMSKVHEASNKKTDGSGTYDSMSHKRIILEMIPSFNSARVDELWNSDMRLKEEKRRTNYHASKPIDMDDAEMQDAEMEFNEIDSDYEIEEADDPGCTFPNHGNVHPGSIQVGLEPEQLEPDDVFDDDVSTTHQGSYLDRASEREETHGSTFLDKQQTPPPISCVRVWFIGSYSMATLTDEAIAVNATRFQTLLASMGGGYNPQDTRATNRPFDPDKIHRSITENADKSQCITSRDELVPALAFITRTGIATGTREYKLATSAPLDDRQNPVCIRTSLGPKTAVGQCIERLHPDFCDMSKYVSADGQRCTIPYPDMAFELETNTSQTWFNLMNSILPVPIPPGLKQASRVKSLYISRAQNHIGGASAPSHDTTIQRLHREQREESARIAYEEFVGSNVSFAASSTIEALEMQNEQERRELHTARREAKLNADPGTRDEVLRTSAWDSQVAFHARSLSGSETLLNAEHPSHSTASESAMRFLDKYLEQNNDILFRYQSKSFYDLSRVSSWIGVRAIVLEVTYKTATAHVMILRMMLCGLNAPDPNPDKLHHLAIGDGGSSKSFALDITMSWSCPGQSEDVTHKTAMADTVPTNTNGVLEGWHEGNPEWFGVGANGKTSTNPLESRFKKRLTSGQVDVESCVLDDDGKRTTVVYRRLCNASVLVNLNLNKHQISQPMQTRFLVTESSIAPRKGKTIAHCICETPTTGQKMSKSNDRENMQWLFSIVILVNTWIRSGALPKVKTRFTNYMLPRVLDRAGKLGLNHTEAPRHILRMLAAVRALVIVRAILYVFASPLSPISIRDTKNGGYTGQPFHMHHFAYLIPHLDDSWDPSIFTIALGLIKTQWETPCRHDVLEAIMSTYFGCSEEVYDRKTKHAIALDASSGGNVLRNAISSSKQSFFHGVSANHDSRRFLHSTNVWEHVSHGDPLGIAKMGALQKSNMMLRMLASGGSAALGCVDDLMKQCYGSPQSGGNGGPNDASTPEIEGRSENMDSQGARGSESLVATASGAPTVLEGFNLPPERDRSTMSGHGSSHCSCCQCAACFDKSHRRQHSSRDKNQGADREMPGPNSGEEPGASKNPDKNAKTSSRAEQLRRAYRAKAKDLTIDPVELKPRIDLFKSGLTGSYSFLDPRANDKDDIRKAKQKRRTTLAKSLRWGVRRTRHLNQSRYKVLEAGYTGSYAVGGCGMFPESMEKYQCIAMLAKVLDKVLLGHTRGAIISVIKELTETLTPVVVGGKTKFLPALSLNVVQRGVMVAKHLLINNKQSILKQIVLDEMEHRYTTTGMLYLFGSGPNQTDMPYLFETFQPIPRRVSPAPMKSTKVSSSHTHIMQHNASQSTASRSTANDAFQSASERHFRTDPSIAFSHDMLNEHAVPQKIAKQFCLLPEALLMKMEHDIVKADQKSWERDMKKLVDRDYKAGSTIESAFANARKECCPEPLMMLSYEETKNETVRSEQQQQDNGTQHPTKHFHSDLDLAKKWEWPRRTRHLEELLRVKQEIGSANGTISAMDDVEYPLYLDVGLDHFA